MKSPVASSSICGRLNVRGLKFQSKASSVLVSGKRASRMRRATARSRRAPASAPSSRSRKFRWDRVSFSARVSSSSSAAGWTGILSVVKWLRQRSRSRVVGSVFFAFMVLLIAGGALQQRLIVSRRPRRQRALAQDLVQLFLRVDHQRFHGRTRLGLRRQDALYRRRRESAVAAGALQRPHQVLASIDHQQGQHAGGLVLAVAPGAQQFLEKADSIRAELHKSLLEQLAFLLVVAARRMRRQAMPLAGGSRWIEVVTGDLLHVRAINDQLVFGDAHRQQFTDAL